MFAYTPLQDAAIMSVVLFYLIGWILPCILSAVVGAKKKRGALGGILCGIGVVCGLLWPVLGCVVGWFCFAVICCFKKREIVG